MRGFVGVEGRAQGGDVVVGRFPGGFSSPMSALILFYMHGAISRIPVNETAFGASVFEATRRREGISHRIVQPQLAINKRPKIPLRPLALALGAGVCDHLFGLRPATLQLAPCRRGESRATTRDGG
jgi:hypothetical protein